MSKEKGVGVYCEAKDFEGRYKIEKEMPLSSDELKVIEIATNFIFQQNEQRDVILTESKNGMPNTDGRRPRLLKGMQNTQKQITIKWIPAQGNEKADLLTKDGARCDIIPYNLKMYTENWNTRSGKNATTGMW
jgi:ribonuclease HI